MAWHQGYPLSQTLFTSHYIENILWPDPRSLSEATFRTESSKLSSDKPLLEVLRAYCIGLIKCCDFVIQCVTNSHYFEEEDFATHTYNRDLLRRYSTSSILNILDDASFLITNMSPDKYIQPLPYCVRLESLTQLQRRQEANGSSIQQDSITKKLAARGEPYGFGRARIQASWTG